MRTVNKKALLNYGWPFGLFVLCVIIVAYSVYVATSRNLSTLENTLLQAFSLLSGLASSFIFGRKSAKDAAIEIIRPHARSAFRRLVALFLSLSDVCDVVNKSNTNGGDTSNREALLVIEAIVNQQLKNADDALADWQDIVPEEVDDLRARLDSKKDRTYLQGQEVA